MDIAEIPSSLQYLCSAGLRLEPEKCLLAASSLRERRCHLNFRDMYFWGKIWGQSQNYYVAFGYKRDVLNGRYHLFSTDCMQWSSLPLTTRRQHEQALRVQEPFSGQPDSVVEVPPGNDETTDDAGDVELTEEVRLACVVALVNHEAAVVPRGALVKRFDGFVMPNDDYKGLAWEDATSLANYYHFRPPMRILAANLRERPSHDLEYDFMDPISKDVVLSHSLKLDKLDRVVTVRSLAWPGLTAFHRVDTPDWGFQYVGFGRRCKLDVPLMLPTTAAAPPMQRRPPPWSPPAPPATPATEGPPVDPELEPSRSPSLVPLPYPRYDLSTASS